MKVRKRQNTDTPSEIKALVERVVSEPAEALEHNLRGFTNWEYGKGDLYQWLDLLNHMDAYLEGVVKSRAELSLEGDLAADSPMPKTAVLEVLRATRMVLENCSNKHLYNSVEHLTSLVAAEDAEIVAAALQTLAVFVRKPLQSLRGVRWQGDPALNARLFALSQGPGTKEEGLGLVACTADGQEGRLDKHRSACALRFEFYQSDEEVADAAGKGLHSVCVPDVHLRPESSHELCMQLATKHRVPARLRFNLLARIRAARGFATLEGRRQLARERLLAFTILMQSNPDHEDMQAFYANEPELVSELVELLCMPEAVPEDVRVLALRALAAQSLDRPRQSAVLQAISAGGNRGTLATLMQSAVSSLGQPSRPGACSYEFVEALLALVMVLVSYTSGWSSLADVGIVPLLLPLLQDTSPAHVPLVSAGLRILEAMMDFSTTAVRSGDSDVVATLLCDLGGLGMLVQRLQHELSAPVVPTTSKGKSPASHRDGQAVGYAHRLLIKALLRAIALAQSAPGHAARAQSLEAGALAACLCTIFQRARDFGGGVFSLGASVMRLIIHHDPTCFPQLESAGLPAAFLAATQEGVVPSSEALCCVPSTLTALCLHPTGLEQVKKTGALSCLVPMFTTKAYLRPLQEETAAVLGTGLDELMRHVPSLRAAGIHAVVRVLKTLCAMGGEPECTEVTSGKTQSPEPMDMDDQEGDSAAVTATAPAPTFASDAASDVTINPAPAGDAPALANPEAAFLPECLSNTARLLESMLSHHDTARRFVEKGGIALLLRLYTLPNLPLGTGGAAQGLSGGSLQSSSNSTTNPLSFTFRVFLPHHAPALASDVRSILNAQLRRTAACADKLGGQPLAEVPAEAKQAYLRALASAEGLLILSATLVRSTTNMLPELTAQGVDVVDMLGAAQRMAHWQLAQEEYRQDSGLNPTSIATPPDSAVSAGPVAPAATSAASMDVAEPPEQGQDAPMETAVSELAAEGTAAAGRKKGLAADTAHDVMTRFATGARTFLVGLARSLMVSMRRRDDPGASPCPTTRATAAALVRVLVAAVTWRGPCHPTSGAAAGKKKAEAETCDTAGSEDPARECVSSMYLLRVVDELSAVVFDTRRRSCNALLLNQLFVQGGAQAVATELQRVAAHLWDAAAPSTDGASSPAKMTVHVGAARRVLSLFENVVNGNLILGNPNSAQLLVLKPEPASASPPAPPERAPPDTPQELVKLLQAQVLGAVLPMWEHDSLARCPAELVASLSEVLIRVAEGTPSVNPVQARPRAPPLRRINVGRFTPSPDAVAQIVAMGFPEAAAQRALRAVWSNSVEMAMEWLLSRPEQAEAAAGAGGEPDEDDELARALTLSLSGGAVEAGEGAGEGAAADGAAGAETTTTAAASTETGATAAAQAEAEAGADEEGAEEPAGATLPSSQSMVATAVKLVSSVQGALFPLTDLLVALCKRCNGEDRAEVVGCLMKELRVSEGTIAPTDATSLERLAHMLVLMMAEDPPTRQVAADEALHQFAIGMLEPLSEIHPQAAAGEVAPPPQWACTLLMALDLLLQIKPETSPAREVNAPPGTGSSAASAEGAATGDDQQQAAAESGDAPETPPMGPLEKIVARQEGFVALEDRTRAMQIVVTFLKRGYPLPPPSTAESGDAPLALPAVNSAGALGAQTLLQVASRLSRTHETAMQFVSEGGVEHLLRLPSSCLFPGYESVAAAVLRHALEDAPTLQAAMEGEIRSAMAASSVARSQGRVAPSPLLNTLACVVARNPVVFMAALRAVCVTEEVNGRSMLTLIKTKEQRDPKDAPKPGAQTQADKQAVRSSGPPSAETPVAKSSEPAPPPTTPSSARKSTRVKPHPGMIFVIEQLMDLVLKYSPLDPAPTDPAPKKQETAETPAASQQPAAQDASSMEVDDGVSVAPTEPLHLASKPAPAEQEEAAMRAGFALRLLTEFSLMYGACAGVVLKRDAEAYLGRGVMAHAMYKLLCRGEERQGVAERATHFLLAVCVRSGEGRRRILGEVAKLLQRAAEKDTPSASVQAFVELLNVLLSASNAGGSSPSSRPPSGLAAELARIMSECGILPALVKALQTVDLDDPEAPKLVNAILKPMEVLTRMLTAQDPPAASARLSHHRSRERRPERGSAQNNNNNNSNNNSNADNNPTSHHGSGARRRSSDGPSPMNESNSTNPRSSGVSLSQLIAGREALQSAMDRAEAAMNEALAMAGGGGEAASARGEGSDARQGRRPEEQGAALGARDANTSQGGGSAGLEGRHARQHHGRPGQEPEEEEEYEEEEHEEEDGFMHEGGSVAMNMSMNMNMGSGGMYLRRREGMQDYDHLMDMPHVEVVLQGDRMHEEEEEEEDGEDGDEEGEDGMEGEEESDGEGADEGLIQRDNSHLRMQARMIRHDEEDDEEDEEDDEEDEEDDDGGDEEDDEEIDEEMDHLPSAWPERVAEHVRWRHSASGGGGGGLMLPAFLEDMVGGATRRERRRAANFRSLPFGPGTDGMRLANGGTGGVGVGDGGGQEGGAPVAATSLWHDAAGALQHPLLVRPAATRQGASGPMTHAQGANSRPHGPPRDWQVVAGGGGLGDQVQNHARNLLLAGDVGSRMSGLMGRMGESLHGLRSMVGMEALDAMLLPHMDPSGMFSFEDDASHLMLQRSWDGMMGPPTLLFQSTDRGVGAGGGALGRNYLSSFDVSHHILDSPFGPAGMDGGRQLEARTASWTDDGQPNASGAAASLVSGLERFCLEQLAPPPATSAPDSGDAVAATASPPEIEAMAVEPESEPAGAGDAPSAHVDATADAPDAANAPAAHPVSNPPPEPPMQQPEDEDTDMQDAQAATADGGEPAPATNEAEPPAPAPLESLAAQTPGADGSGAAGAGDAEAPGAETAMAAAASPNEVGPAEIDPSFLEALPPELRAEVLATQLEAQARAQAAAAVAAMQSSLASAGRVSDAVVADADTEMNTDDGLQTPATQDNAGAQTPAAGEANAEPPPSASHQATETPTDDAGEDVMALDPEFLAALPPDIQAELIQQQQVATQASRAMARARTSIAATDPGAAAAAPSADMDSASIIATFPPELRQEVLLTSDESLLAALPPELLAEAQELRERAMHQFSAPRREAQATLRAIPTPTHHRSSNTSSGRQGFMELISGGRVREMGTSSRMKDAEGAPLLDEQALETLVSLVRLAQPLAKGLLQRLLLNLCAHSETRTSLLRRLMSILQGSGGAAELAGGDERAEADGAALAEPRPPKQQQLFGCPAHVVYARGSDGVPPLVTRRVLEVVNYLARHHPRVAALLLWLRVQPPAADALAAEASRKGKAKMAPAASEVEMQVEAQGEWVEAAEAAAEQREEEGDARGSTALHLLLDLLGEGESARSSGHVEQALSLLELVLREAHSGVAPTAPKEVPSSDGGEAATSAAATAEANTEANVDVGAGHSSGEPAAQSGKEDKAAQPDKKSEARPKPKVSPSMRVLYRLPSSKVCQCASLLARDGLSESVYEKCARMIQLLAVSVPNNKQLIVTKLMEEAAQLAQKATSELRALAQEGGEGEEVRGPASTGQGGVGLLRVIKAAKKLVSKDGDDKLPNQPALGVVVEDLHRQLKPFWDELSACMTAIEAQLALSSAPARAASATSPAAQSSSAGQSHRAAPPTEDDQDTDALLMRRPASLPPAALRILPLVEAFFVICECLQQGASNEISNASKQDPVSGEGEAGAPASEFARGFSGGTWTSLSPKSPDARPLLCEPLARFSEKHRKLINAFLRQSSKLLDGSLSLLLQLPRLIDFDNKRVYFRARIQAKRVEGYSHSGFRICVRRPPHLLEDSFRQIRMRSEHELRGKLTVQFQGEEGIDAGGVTREWYTVLAREMFNVENALFVTVADNSATFQPNPNSYVHPDHLAYFRFIGRIVGKALFDRQLLDAHFSRSFYKHMLGTPITYEDIEAIDPNYYKNLKWMLENDITNVLDLNFSAELDHFGKHAIVDLKPNGANIPVTEANKLEYVQLVSQHRMTTAIQEQIAMFKEGFHALIPKNLISIFNDRELELLISGLPEIDVDDLQANTEYTGYTPASPVIQWFWEVVRAFSKEDLARFLQFCTGTTKVPLEGFKALQGISGPQRFQIHRAYGAPARLVSAHTCFNQLDLPEYANMEQLQERLTLAIHEGNEGFGFG